MSLFSVAQATAPAENGDPTGALRRINFRLMPFLFLLYIIAYLDRVNVGFAQLQMSSALHFGAAVYGTGAGIFFLGYFIFEIPSNLALEKVGARRWICRIMLSWGVVAGCMAFTRSAVSFYSLRFLLGIAEAGFFPGIVLYLTYWYTAAERARVIGFLMTATVGAFIVGGPISGLLLGIHAAGMAGWQWLFVLEAVPAVVLGFVVLSYLPDRPSEARWLSPEQKDWLEERLTREQRETAAHRVERLREALKDWRVWQLALLYLLMVTGLYGINLWMPVIIKGMGKQSNVQTGLLTAVPNIAAAFSLVLVGAHSDRHRERRWHIAVCAILGAAALVETGLAGTPTAQFLWLIFAAAAMQGTLGPFWALPPSFLGRAAAAGGIAMVNSVGNLGGFFGPQVVGLIQQSTHQFKGGLFFLAGCMACAGLVALTVRTDARRGA